MLKYILNKLRCTFASKTTKEVNLYLRTDGNDNNDGFTPDTALLTHAEVVKRIPDFEDHDVIVHLGAAPDASGWPLETLPRRIGRGNITYIGDGAGEPGNDGFTEVLSSTAALAGSGLRVVKSAGMDTNAFWAYMVPEASGIYCGLTIEILDGDAAGDRRDIKYNTATDIVPVCAFSAQVQTGDHYRIVRPSIPIYANQYKFFEGYGSTADPPDSRWGTDVWQQLPTIFLVNVYCNYINATDTDIVCIGVKSQYGITIIGPNVRVRSGIETYWDGSIYDTTGVPYGVNLDAPSSTSWLGWGLASYGDNAYSILRIYDDAEVTGSFVIGGVVLSGEARFDMEMGRIWRVGIAAWGWGFEDNHNKSIHINAIVEDIEIFGFGIAADAPLYCGDHHTTLHAFEGTITIHGHSWAVFAEGQGVIYICIAAGSTGSIVLKNESASPYAGCVTTVNCGVVNFNFNLLDPNYVFQPKTANHDLSVDYGRVWHPVADLPARFTALIDPIWGSKILRGWGNAI